MNSWFIQFFLNDMLSGLPNKFMYCVCKIHKNDEKEKRKLCAMHEKDKVNLDVWLKSS